MILNDRPDLADRMGADGVHIGQTDMSYADARRLMGKDRIVGVTAHNSRHLAMEAAEAGADYVAFGAFYPTETKQPDRLGRAGDSRDLAGDDGDARASPSAALIWRMRNLWCAPARTFLRLQMACGATRRVPVTP